MVCPALYPTGNISNLFLSLNARQRTPSYSTTAKSLSSRKRPPNLCYSTSHYIRIQEIESGVAGDVRNTSTFRAPGVTSFPISNQCEFYHFSRNDKYSIQVGFPRHQISIRPVENVDFFHHQPAERKQFLILQEDGASLRCARCKHPANLRIRTQTAVLKHLKDKYGGTSLKIVTIIYDYFPGIRSRDLYKGCILL